MNSPEETPRSTNEPGDVVLEAASRQELVQEVYNLQASLSAARAQKELAETRLELAQSDLKRQLLRVKEYREFGRQWRELLVSEVSRLGMELERVNQEAEACLKVLMQLAEEPDGQHVPSLVEVVMGRRDWVAQANRAARLEGMSRGVPPEVLPDWVERSERKPAMVDMDGPTSNLDRIIAKAGLSARKDGKPLDDPSPDAGPPSHPSQYPGDGTGDSGVEGKA